MTDSKDEPTREDPSNAEPPRDLIFYFTPRGEDRVFELADWPDEATSLARSLLDASEVTQRWEGDKIVVSAADRQEVQDVLGEVVAIFSSRLDAGSDRVGYDFDGWPPDEIDRLIEALIEAGIGFEWNDDGELLVLEEAEATVDLILDELELHGPQDDKVHLDGEQLTGLLTDQFTAADRLAKNPQDGEAVISFATLALETREVAVPIGMSGSEWEQMVAEVVALRDILASDVDAEDEAIKDRAQRIRSMLQAWL